MVRKMIGLNSGTGGTSGSDYLRSTLRYLFQNYIYYYCYLFVFFFFRTEASMFFGSYYCFFLNFLLTLNRELHNLIRNSVVGRKGGGYRAINTNLGVSRWKSKMLLNLNVVRIFLQMRSSNNDYNSPIY